MQWVIQISLPGISTDIINKSRKYHQTILPHHGMTTTANLRGKSRPSFSDSSEAHKTTTVHISVVQSIINPRLSRLHYPNNLS